MATPTPAAELAFAQEYDAKTARRALIREGRRVSLVALDFSRNLYVFDVYGD